MHEMIAGWFGGTTLGLLVVAFWMVAKTATSVVRLERKVDVLLKHSGVDLTAVAAREAEVFVKAGRKIEAIKVYRELTGVGLAEAKAAVEKL